MGIGVGGRGPRPQENLTTRLLLWLRKHLPITFKLSETTSLTLAQKAYLAPNAYRINWDYLTSLSKFSMNHLLHKLLRKHPLLRLKMLFTIQCFHAPKLEALKILL